MGINFWCSERDLKRWRLAIYVQDGSGHSIITPQKPTESLRELSAVSATDYQSHGGWINYIGTQPERVIFGDLETSDIAMDVPSDWGGKKLKTISFASVKLK